MGRKARVLLLTPNLRGMKDGLNRIQPPLGPMIISGVLRRAGHRVAMHDTALAAWHRQEDLGDGTVRIGQSDAEIAETIGAHDPDVVGISALFSNLLESAQQIARITKRVKPSATVVLGGNHISNAAADHLHALAEEDSGIPIGLEELEKECFDYAMRGESDLAFPELVDRLAAGEDVADVPGLIARDARGVLRVNPLPPQVRNLSELPHPARDLVDMQAYFDIGSFHSAKSRSKRVLNVMASRGCPETCTFCTTPAMWGSKVRWRSTEDIAAEIREAVSRFSIGEIQFEDDTITARRKNLLELCRELEKVGLPWCTPNGTKTNYHMASQPELYRAMADSGCYQITLACESGVQRVLDDVIRKNLSVDEIRPAIENAKNAGMLVHTFWILGFPGETHEEIRRTIDFALASGADSFSFAILSPLPGTPIYRKVAREKLWWPGRHISDLMYRTSLVRVDGFSGPDEFEEFVRETNVRANRLLAERDPDRFRLKYGTDTSERMLVKQT